MDTESLAHTQWNCKYHIVFAPKYRRQVIYHKIKSDIGKILSLRIHRYVSPLQYNFRFIIAS
ncbi:Transposase IS200 like protein [Pelotomaculum schinkii]|uniref:Transposase IS200 like protein n=1 Tax=Pelotomaculum schinkii TaxID=78350 RepID=A0A4Y7R7B6_9FIRM|nr:Transposase IS200 like protein [Pelotomaculum schinkii]